MRTSGFSGKGVVKVSGAKPARPPLSRRRKWLYRLTAVVVLPLLFLGLLEGGLRMAGYGYPTSFFLGPDARGISTTNIRFGWRFFPRSLARLPETSFLSAKPADTIRIFTLGSSAAQGVPNPSFNFGRILEAMLRRRYPDRKFEVINTAMTAINSHVGLVIASDCAAHQPDLFVVYMGNNEVVGPFGPGTVFQQWTPSRRIIRANVWLKSTRVGQWLGDTVGAWFQGKDALETWKGMEMFLGNQVAADDPRLETVYDNYRQNLTDICGIARDAGAGIILSTVAVNLKDCPPLASRHRSDLSAEALEKWHSQFEAGVALEAERRWAEALARYEAAAEIDDRFAELPFRMGRCLAALGRSPEARERFVAARDLDALRFRADSRINTVIREVAAEQAKAGVRLADAEQFLAKSRLAPGGILGEELFYEHVHLRFDGNYLLARCVLDQIGEALPQLADSKVQEPVLSRDQCAAELVLTPWDEHAMDVMIDAMTSRPPFTNQLGHAAREAALRKRLEESGRATREPEAMRKAQAAYEAALKKTPDDWNLHYRFGLLLLAGGQPAQAVEHFEFVRKTIPWEASVHEKLGEALDECRRYDEAIVAFRKAVEIEPNLSTAHSDLGGALNAVGHFDEAVAEYQIALKIYPESALFHFNFGTMLKDHGQINEAVAQYEETLRIDPTFAMADNNLGDIFSKLGRIDASIVQFQKALEIDPKLLPARNNLANALRNRGRIDEAIAEYQKALAIDPKNAVVHLNFGIALYGIGKLDEAAGHFEEALKLDPKLAIAHNCLGNCCCKRGRFSEGIVHFQKALEIMPDYAEARVNLEKALKVRH
jgi:tetratricopeptide (TPR) repeat protein